MSERLVDSHLETVGKDDGLTEERAKAAVQYANLSQSDRHFLKELEALPPIGALPVEEERVRMQAGQITTLADYPVEILEYQTSACPVHLIWPLAVQAPAPVLFFLHGGGWVLGDLRTHTKLVCELAVRSQCVVGFIEYPRAPENPFPVPLEASITALNEVLQQAEVLGLDRSRFAVAGDSSGGNLTAALILSAIERKLPLPVRQVLLYPATNHDWTTPSYKEFGANPNLSQFTMKWFWDHYLPEKSLSSDPRVSPLRARDAALSLFPPTLVVTCEYDVLCDDGELFAACLVRAGIDVTAVRWLGSLHGFLVTESLSASASAQTCIDMVALYIRRGFGQR